jgi:hypothetical protein
VDDDNPFEFLNGSSEAAAAAAAQKQCARLAS